MFYGEDVTYTLQLRGDDPDSTATPKPKADVGPGSGVTYTVAVEPDEDGFKISEEYAAGADGSLVFKVSDVHPTANLDRDPGSSGTETIVEVVITAVHNKSTITGDKSTLRFKYTDTPSAVTKIVASVDGDDYKFIDDDPADQETATVIATVYDQYGKIVKDIRVALDANNDNSIDATEENAADKTDSDGRVSFTAVNNLATASTVTVQAIADGDSTTTETWEVTGRVI